ncbi:Virulence-associated protein [Fulvimarina pelagi HTCC2506]|uniref:Virulence-associated protein n=1 Tax=Fulvimarina pelagi HTCC2506 TaxID=314231 RepID=Q0FZ05_9HYPH|nr:DUF4815 domain-containing protein [Fulvimarina pelagi]EAU40153.1 Virulence-associated protein [Fulvimarina pelagi HTCC2506]
MAFALANYFNRRRDGTSPQGEPRSGADYIARRFAELLHRGRQFVESAEANEAQQIAYERQRSIGDQAFGPVSLRDGGTIVVDSAAGTVTLGESLIWAGGYMHQVAAATLTGVPMVGTVAIGIAVSEMVVTDVEDVDLKGIVPNTESHGKELAARLRYDAVWARDGDPFYPIFTIVDGVVPSEPVAPFGDLAERAVERHVEETHGSHIIDGFDALSGGYDAATGEQVYLISAGVLRAAGRRITRSVDTRHRQAENPVLKSVVGEIHNFVADGADITLSHGPIADVQLVTVVKERTETLTHQLAGGSDPMTSTPVYSIQSVVRGGTTYVKGTDYKLTADKVDWSLPGAEPNPGDSYTVTYRYTSVVAPDEIGRTSLQVSGAVTGLPVTINYRWKLKRRDVIAIDRDGGVVMIEGVSSAYQAYPPRVPAPLAPLAIVEHLWGIAAIVTPYEQRRMTEAEVRSLLRFVVDNADLISQLRLKLDVQDRDPASRRGSFVDDFISDQQRDEGIVQNAAIVDGTVQLPITVTSQEVDIGTSAIMLAGVIETIVEQPYRTAKQPINKYQAFDPLPGQVTLRPAVDRWHDVTRSTETEVTRQILRTGHFVPGRIRRVTDRGTTIATRIDSINRTSEAARFLRRIAVTFTIKFAAPGETLTEVTFDRIAVPFTGGGVADASGTITGTFTIPANVRTGRKAVRFVGNAGLDATARFEGSGQITSIVVRQTRSITRELYYTDPVAQSFKLAEDRILAGASFEFTDRGDPDNRVICDLRPMRDGYPVNETLAEGAIEGNAFALSNPNLVQEANWTAIDFALPIPQLAGEERAIALLTDDADHAVAYAELGSQNEDGVRGYDKRRQEWVRSNPYGGVMFEASNESTWVAKPAADLTFRLRAWRFTSTTRTVIIGTFNVEDVSDILVLLVVDEPTPETRVTLELVRASGEVISFDPNERLSLPEYVSESVTIRMVLTGTATMSPIVYPTCQILWGTLETVANYVSEATSLDQTYGNLKVRTVLEANAPGGSSIALDIGGDGAWDTQAAVNSTDLGDGWIEREYLEGAVSDTETRVQIRLTGTPAARPSARALRLRATEV